MEMPQPQSTPAPEGVSAQTEPQATEPQVQPQESASAQVENGDNVSPSQEQTRRPTDYWAGRQIKKLERQLSSLQEELRSSRQSQPSVPQAPSAKPAPISADDYWKDPFGYLERMKESVVSQVKEEWNQTYQQREQERQLESGRREARDLVLKNELVKKDPQWKERFDDILSDDRYNLDDMSVKYPRQAAALALELYQSRYANGNAKRSPYAAPKSTMASTATGVASGSGRATVEDVQRLQAELAANPALAADPAFSAKVNALKAQRVQTLSQG